jgi:hypothetical protein
MPLPTRPWQLVSAWFSPGFDASSTPPFEISNKNFAAIVDCQNGRTNSHKQEIFIRRQALTK